jgi:excisionase family DNA binding protein
MHRAFAIDVLECPHWGGRLRLVAALRDPAVIRKLLAHLGMAPSGPSPGPRRPDGSGRPPVLLDIHTNMPGAVPPDVSKAIQSGGPAPSGLSDEERRTHEKLKDFFCERRGLRTRDGDAPANTLRNCGFIRRRGSLAYTVTVMPSRRRRSPRSCAATRRLLSPDQAARYLGVGCRWTIRRLVVSGALPVVKIAGKWRLDVEDLDKLISAKKSVAPELGSRDSSSREANPGKLRPRLPGASPRSRHDLLVSLPNGDSPRATR